MLPSKSCTYFAKYKTLKARSKHQDMTMWQINEHFTCTANFLHASDENMLLSKTAHKTLNLEGCHFQRQILFNLLTFPLINLILLD